MKTIPLRGFAVLGLLLLAPCARAVTYTYVYDLTQSGYNDGGTVRGTIEVRDNDGNSLISAGDDVGGSLIFQIGVSLPFIRGFDVTSIEGQSILTGSFSIAGVGTPNGSITVTNTGGTVINYAFPFTGDFTTSTTDQAPVVRLRVPEGGSVNAMLSAALLCMLAHRRITARSAGRR